MSELRRLAEAVGLVTGYQATTGAWVEPSEEDLLATLQRYGLDLDSAGDAPALLADRERRRRAIEPVLVAWDGRLGPVPVASALPVGLLRLESGEERDLPIHDDHVLPPPGRLPFGRHELLVTGPDGEEHTSVVFAAPEVAWRAAAGTERRWGIFAPTYALRRQRDPSAIGDLADLEAAFDWLHEQGGQVVVTLPMLATFLDQPADVSPYAPISRRFWNELYADVRAVADRAGLSLGGADGELVDYADAWAPRRRAIALLSDRLLADPELEHWLEQHPDVDTYARFRAAGARHGRDWRAWPTRLPAGDPAEVRFHHTAQWLMDRQLARLHRKVGGRGQLLALDLPVGSHPDGFDVWEQGELFVAGVSVGAPPDSFFTLGQDWGFPPIHPERSREQGHAYLQACIRHHVQHAGLLRVDHILGLLRLYWVRSEAGARRGVYVRYPLEELLAVIALEASRAGAVVVGENLGTVPPEVTAAMTQHGIMGCAVSQFDAYDVFHDGGQRPIPVPPAASIATLNTHDTATFAAFWSGEDADDRSELGLLDEEELAAEHRQRAVLRGLLRDRLGLADEATGVEAAAALLEVASAGEAALVVLNVEDGWAEAKPQNVPGTVSERPNWRRRVAVPLEDWADHDGLATLVGAVRRHRPGWVRDGGWRRGRPDD
ncbi:MAG: 4-alpha-glucanotransferase [Acidimicrobiales bacterium]|nr:4-alpha-glucanotransferase [Acidimicrobiales bacterium]